MSDEGMTEAEGSVVFAHVGLIIQKMFDAGVFDRSASSAIPRAALNCGEAATLIPMLFVMLAQRFPSFSDPDALSELMSRAYLDSAGGKPH